MKISRDLSVGMAVKCEDLCFFYVSVQQRTPKNEVGRIILPAKLSQSLSSAALVFIQRMA